MANMDEPTLADVLEAVRALAVLTNAVDETARERFEQLDKRFDVINQRLDLISGRLEILIDAYGVFRRDYLRDHPQPDVA